MSEPEGGWLMWTTATNQTLMLDLTGVPLANETNFVVVPPANSLTLQLRPGTNPDCVDYDAWVRINGAGAWIEVEGPGPCPGEEVIDNRPKIIVH